VVGPPPTSGLRFSSGCVHATPQVVYIQCGGSDAKWYASRVASRGPLGYSAERVQR
jgi:hypothetical protein